MLLRPMHALFALFLLLTAAACGGRELRSPLEPLERAAASVDDGSTSGDKLSLAAWHAWLVRGDAQRAEALAQAAVERGGQRPWARMALAEAARRRIDIDGEAEALLELIGESPSHPLALLAASRLEPLVGRSLTLDEALEAKAAALLEAGEVRGEVAARLRGIRLDVARGGDPAQALALAEEAGRLGEVALVGPLEPFSFLKFGEPRPAYEAGPVEGEGLRTLRIPDGTLSLDGETGEGDLYYALSRVEVQRGGRFLVRVGTAASTSVALSIDGIPILERRAFGEVAPTELAREVELDRGAHLLALRMSRGNGSGVATVEIASVDGRPSTLTFHAAGVGDEARRGGVRLRGEVHGGGRALATELQREVGILAAWAGASYALRTDPEGARALLAGALHEAPGAIPLLSLRALAFERDPTVPSRIGRDRAASDLAAIRARDPRHPQATLHLAALHRGARRFQEAAELLEEAQSAGAPAVEVLREAARLASARGFDPLAASRAKEAFALAPGDCDVGGRAFLAAQRERDASTRAQIAESLSRCPGGERRLFRLHLDGGRYEEALSLAEKWATLAPSALSSSLTLAQAHLAAGRPEDAAAILQAAEAIWPRSSLLPRLRSEYLGRAGALEGAREARLQALQLDGSDLSLLLVEAFERRQEVLADRDPDAAEAIRAFEAAGRSYDAPAVTLIDFVGVEVHGDGTRVERVHTLSKILDKRGIDLLGEAHLPPGAEILALHTIKADGRILEPESIAAKDSISMPGLEVGDYVEIQTLHTSPGRGPMLEGWSSPRFFFQAREIPIVDSLFVVRVEKAMGMEVDLHQGPPAGEIIDEGSHLVYVARQRHSPAFIGEPGSVPLQEILPWVQVGGGAGERELAPVFADRLLGATRTSTDVERWARDAAAGGQTGEEKVRLVWERLMEEIEGSGSVQTPAPFILHAKRGNRAVLLKAALDALGIENDWVALRTFDQDPAPYRFPSPDRWGRLALVARPDPAGGWLWLDPNVRHGSLGQVAPDIRGASGWVLPREGSVRGFPTMAPLSPIPAKRLTYLLELESGGALRGEATERYQGFDAAQARAMLERLGEDGLRQTVEASLSKGFRGAALEEVDWAIEEDEVRLRYTFGVEGWARPTGGETLAADLDFTRVDLGRRFLSGGARRTPLFLQESETAITETELRLPPGVEVVSAPEAAREVGDFGDFRRAVAINDDAIVIRDQLNLERGRVAPVDYPGFEAWALAVDRALADGLWLERVPLLEEEPPPLEGEEAPEEEAPAAITG